MSSESDMPNEGLFAAEPGELSHYLTKANANGIKHRNGSSLWKRSFWLLRMHQGRVRFDGTYARQTAYLRLKGESNPDQTKVVHLRIHPGSGS